MRVDTHPTPGRGPEDPASTAASVRKRPPQVDRIEVEISDFVTLFENTLGGIRPNASWGRSSL